MKKLLFANLAASMLMAAAEKGSGGGDDAEKATAAAHEAEVKAQAARDEATNAGMSKEERAALDAEREADDARAAAAEIVAKAEADKTAEPTKAVEAGVLAPTTVQAPDRLIGDHLAQKFSNTPANPKAAEGVDENADHVETGVKLICETSDTKATGKPLVTYQPEAMVGDYLRAGWTRA